MCAYLSPPIFARFALFIGFAGLLFSPTADSEENTTSDDITVFGEKPSDAERATREEQFFRAYSRQTVGQQTIQENGSSDITDAIDDVPGVTINSQGAFNKNITIRGLNGPRITTIVDGVKIGNQGMNHSGAGEINMIDLDSVQAIDVVKGSPSVIYDPGASGGLVIVQTQKAPLSKGIGVRQKLNYDDGYSKFQSSTMVKGSNGKIGGLLMYSIDNASDYKFSEDDRTKDLLVNRYNFGQQFSFQPKTFNDLGYESTAITARGSVALTDDLQIDADIDHWEGKDMVLIHGNTTTSAGLIQYERMERDRYSISASMKKLGVARDLRLKLSNQSLYQLGGSATELDSSHLNLNFSLPWSRSSLHLGAEAILDAAETLVYSEQDYYAAFASYELDLGPWILSAGLRSNHWYVRQKLHEGTNRTVAEQLLGISGSTPEKSVSGASWALGMVYRLKETHHLSANFSATFRAPDLYERYAFGSGFIGGGLGMSEESGYHAEIAWKYLDKSTSLAASLFYSHFDKFINAKVIRQIIDKDGLARCITSGLCDPLKDDYNDREGDFFQQYVKYYVSDEVTNWGAEVAATHEYGPHQAAIGLAFNKIVADDPFVFSHAQPIALNLSYRYSFLPEWGAWAKLRSEYVLNYPKVKQTGGFDPYFTADVLAGIHRSGFSVNAGIRNITDLRYRPPYNGINALERSYFVGVSYQWGH